MGLVRRGVLHIHYLQAIHLHQKAQGGAHELASEVLTYGEVLVNNMNSLLVGTKQKTLFCLWPWHSWASLLLQCCLDNSTCLSLAAEDRSQAHDIVDLQDKNNGMLVVAELLWHQSAWQLRSGCTSFSCLLQKLLQSATKVAFSSLEFDFFSLLFHVWRTAYFPLWETVTYTIRQICFLSQAVNRGHQS